MASQITSTIETHGLAGGYPCVRNSDATPAGWNLAFQSKHVGEDR